jgi:hypothetical protein
LDEAGLNLLHMDFTIDRFELTIREEEAPLMKVRDFFWEIKIRKHRVPVIF